MPHQIPAMLSTGTVTRNSVTRNARRPDYRPDDVQRPQGQLPMAPSMPGADDLDAETGGWDPHSHKGQKGGEDCHIDSFLTKLEEGEVDYITDVFGLTGNEFVTPLAQVWGWFQELRTRGAYTLGTEK